MVDLMSIYAPHGRSFRYLIRTRAHTHATAHISPAAVFPCPSCLLGPFFSDESESESRAPPSPGQSSTPSFPSSTYPSLYAQHTHEAQPSSSPPNHAITVGHSYSICVYRSQPNGKLRTSERTSIPLGLPQLPRAKKDGDDDDDGMRGSRTYIWLLPTFASVSLDCAALNLTSHQH